MPAANLPYNEAARVASLLSCNVLDTPEDPIFDDITQMAAELLDVPICAVSLVDEARQWFKSRYGLDATETPRDVAFCAYTILMEETLVIEDATRDERTRDNPLVTGEMGIRSYAGHPLILDDGSAVGALCVIDTEVRSFDERQLKMLRRLARQVTQLLHLSRESWKSSLAQCDARSLRNALNEHTLFSIADAAGRIVDVNDGFCKLSGYTREELLGQDHRLLNSGYHSRDFWKQMWHTIRSGKHWRGEVCNRAKDGSLYWVDSTNIPQLDDDGKVTGFVSLRFDITEKMRATTQNEQMLAALNSCNDCVFMFDAQSLEFIYTNHGASEQIGYTPEELASMTPVDIKPSFDHESFLKAIQPLYNDPSTSMRFRTEHRHKDGHNIPVEISLQLIASLGESGRFIAIVHDITDQMAAERKLMEAKETAEQVSKNLEDAHERYELAIAGSRDAIFDWDISRDKLYLAPRWAELLRCSQDDLGAEIGTLTKRVVSDDVQRIEQELRTFIREGPQAIESEFRLMVDDGSVLWVMLRAAAKRGPDGVAYRISGAVADISGLKASQEKMRILVQQDQLTGLASRSRYMERLDHALSRCRRNGTHCAVLFIDLDRFKQVNDTLGHNVGDELLKSIAQRLKANLRDIDTIARFGGDEFVILLEDLECSQKARLVADKLVNLFAKPHEIAGHQLLANASIGLVTTELTRKSATEMLRDADAAMYQAKAKGRGCIVEFDQEMHHIALDHFAIEEDLRDAVNNNQLRLYYQPIVDLRSGATVSAEALIRWFHPERGMVPPAKFIPIAEESNQIAALGEWVILEACRQISEWKRLRVISKAFAVSVNISKIQLMLPEFVPQLCEMVSHAGLEPRDLKLEVTETTLVDNRSGVPEVLKELRALGFTVMMDDFGTGHSSLSGLHTLPIDELKIDQSFIQNVDTSREVVAITASIVTLADHLYLRTIGEGIETIDHLALLIDLGCTYGQGYYFSKPIPPEEFQLWLSARSGEQAA